MSERFLGIFFLYVRNTPKDQLKYQIKIKLSSKYGRLFYLSFLLAASASASQTDQDCSCHSLQNPDVVLAMLIWAILLSLIVVVLFVMVSRLQKPYDNIADRWYYAGSIHSRWATILLFRYHIYWAARNIYILLGCFCLNLGFCGRAWRLLKKYWVFTKIKLGLFVKVKKKG